MNNDAYDMMMSNDDFIYHTGMMRLMIIKSNKGYGSVASLGSPNMGCRK